MAKRQTATEIATWAEKQGSPSCQPKSKRLTALDIGWLLKAAKEGMPQREIAERLGVTQAAVSKWVVNTSDSTDTAKLFLRGQALRMAKNIVQKGRAADHIKALEGINVLSPDQVSGITVQIGIKADTVKLLGSTFALPGAVVSEGQ